jgi:hypothetical protein
MSSKREIKIIDKENSDLMEIDVNKVKTVKDIALLMSSVGYRFRRNTYGYEKIEHLLKPQGK